MQSIMYPLKPPSRRRDTKQMQVLCLGLSRSGTDSLRNALQILGYNQVCHGFVITARQREDCAFWVPLMRRKFQDPEKFDREMDNVDFDEVLGECEAVTDGPANVFGEELMKYYPEAKVVLNKRRNVAAWHASMRNTCLEVFSWPMWTLSWFNTGICWLWWNFDLVMRGYYQGDFETNGMQVWKEHYQQLKESCDAQRREYLDWGVEDGWQPLCEFLRKPVPNVPFPDGNKGSGQFQDNMEEATRDLVMGSLRNIIIFVSVFFAGAATAWYKLG